MALTKEDLTRIKSFIEGSADNLARIVAKGFEQTATKNDIARLEAKIAKVELEVVEIKERVVYIERDTAEIRKGLISRMELEDILVRISLVERKLGIKSGK